MAQGAAATVRAHGAMETKLVLSASSSPSLLPNNLLVSASVFTYREEGSVDTAESKQEASSMASLWECLESAVLRLNGAPSLAKHGLSHLWQCQERDSGINSSYVYIQIKYL